MKRYKQQKIIRSQLDETLKQFSVLTSVNRPMKGWIRAVRDALGMGMRQLATRMGVHTSRISKIESDEISGNLTLKTMEKVADSLDCVFVYGLVPRRTFESNLQLSSKFSVDIMGWKQKAMIDCGDDANYFHIRIANFSTNPGCFF